MGRIGFLGLAWPSSCTMRAQHLYPCRSNRVRHACQKLGPVWPRNRRRCAILLLFIVFTHLHPLPPLTRAESPLALAECKANHHEEALAAASTAARAWAAACRSTAAWADRAPCPSSPACSTAARVWAGRCRRRTCSRAWATAWAARTRPPSSRAWATTAAAEVRRRRVRRRRLRRPARVRRLRAARVRRPGLWPDARLRRRHAAEPAASAR